MALEASARNLYSPTAFVDANVVPIVITSAGKDADRTAPAVTVGAGASGVYACTMPAGQFQILLGREVRDTGAAGAKTVTVSGYSVAAGVASFNITLSGGSNVAATEEVFVTFLVIGA
jgi:hypothetical protein